MKLRGNLEDQCEGSKGCWRPCFDCGLKMHSVFKTYAVFFTPKQSGWSETELNGHRRKGWLCWSAGAAGCFELPYGCRALSAVNH